MSEQHILDHAELYDLAYYRGRPPDQLFLDFLHTRLISLAPGRKLLDCACGTGEPGLSLVDCFSVTLTDASPAMIRTARANALSRGLGALQFFCLPWTELPFFFPPHFDVVLCAGNSIEQLRDPLERGEALAAMAAVLAPGGVLYVDYAEWVHSSRTHLDVVDIAGPHSWQGQAVMVACFERVCPELIQRLKVAYSLSDLSLERVASSRSFSARVSALEVQDALAACGLTDITSLPRPGRWQLTAVFGRKRRE
jgi:SAM-dependent methyltransferase